ncbi:MAG: enolase C-terminal domain-like protein [Saccharolobus sp.]|uniref:mandelate racemase/muconate lactonizing enzyme family protein n=1 Tax=Saccharolobus sp. TaxID=2100761 RepID=UPI003172B6FD
MDSYIKKCEPFLIEVPLREKYRTAHGEVSTHKSVIVRLETIDGYQGYGQVDPIPTYSNESAEEVYVVIKKYIAPFLIGKSPYSISSIMEEIDKIFPSNLHLESRAAISIALYDLVGKMLKTPVHSLLGKVYRREIPVVGWIGIEEPEIMSKKAIKKLEEGYKSIKIKITGSEKDVERVAKIREAIGYNVELRADANESLIPINILRKLEKYELKWIEQPFPRRFLDHLVEIKKKIDIPILIDESVSDLSSLLYILKRRLADCIKLKILKQGGIDSVKMMVKICEAEKISCTIGHGFDMSISAMAELHVIASSKHVEEVNEVGGPYDKMNDDIVCEGLEFSKGCYKINDMPGLGLTIDEDKLQKYSRNSIN